jgi:Rap1a immunity proteins
MSKVVLTLSLFLIIYPAFALGQDSDDFGETVQSLYGLCSAQTDTFKQVGCLEYVAGEGDYMSMLGDGTANAIIGICGHPTHGAEKQAFLNWATKHPEQWDAPKWYGVASALRETWACQPPKSN